MASHFKLRHYQACHACQLSPKMGRHHFYFVLGLELTQESNLPIAYAENTGVSVQKNFTIRPSVGGKAAIDPEKPATVRKRRHGIASGSSRRSGAAGTNPALFSRSRASPTAISRDDVGPVAVGLRCVADKLTIANDALRSLSLGAKRLI
jgi:hypothetical protein